MDSTRMGLRLGHALLVAALALIGSAAPTPSRASEPFYVRQPDVEKSETDIEEHSTAFAGPGEDEQFHQNHEIELERGLTDRWKLLVEGVLEQPVGGNLQATEFELGGQYEFIKPQGEDGFAAAFRTLYEWIRDGPDEIFFGPIARYAKGADSTTLNIFFAGQVGDHPDIDGLELQYNWQLKHELSHRLAFGVEAFGDIEDLAHPGSFNDQLHRVGPVIYLNFGDEEDDSRKRLSDDERAQESNSLKLEMAAGVLFGLTDATSDVTFKLDAELEF
jgi:hypothetical protein